MPKHRKGVEVFKRIAIIIPCECGGCYTLDPPKRIWRCICDRTMDISEDGINTIRDALAQRGENINPDTWVLEAN
jgi:hypothetical protein